MGLYLYIIIYRHHFCVCGIFFFFFFDFVYYQCLFCVSHVNYVCVHTNEEVFFEHCLVE